MKRIISIVLAIVMLFSMNVLTVAEENIPTVTYDEETQTLVFSGSGRIEDYLVEQPVKHIVIKDGVSRIENSFNGLEELEDVIIHRTRSIFLVNCFNDCDALESLEVNYYINMYDSFKNCSNLSNVQLMYKSSISDSLINLPSLEHITIPDETLLRYGTLSDCPMLKTVILGRDIIGVPTIIEADFDSSDRYPLSRCHEDMKIFAENVYERTDDDDLCDLNIDYIITDLPCTMTSEKSENGITLSWQDKEDVAESIIFRKEKDDTGWVFVGKTEDNSYCDTTAQKGEKYQYMNCGTLELSKEIVYTDLDFVDVKDGSWYESYAYYAAENKIMIGVSESEFAPDRTVDRATFVTALAKLTGVYDSLDKNAATVFEDVPTGKWYTGAVAWAYENEIVEGTSETTFAPTDDITREQLCTMLFRYSKKFGFTMVYGYTDGIDDIAIRHYLKEFKDNKKISDYAKEAITVCILAEIVNGMGDGTFAPKETATRAQMAKILTIFHKKYMS